MDLKAISAAAVTVAFTAAGTVRKAAKLVKVTNTSYAPATGVATNAATEYAVNVIFTDFRQDEIDGKDVLATDQRILIDAAELGAVQVAPNDYVTTDNSATRWQVQKVSRDPSESLWRLHGRKT